MAEVTVAWRAAAETSACRMVIMMCCIRRDVVKSAYGRVLSFYVIVMGVARMRRIAWQVLGFDWSVPDVVVVTAMRMRS